MPPLCDYHMHTPLCGHATGEPKEYAEQAIKTGLKEIGFSDHAPLVAYFDPAVSMRMDQIGNYHRMIEEARDAFMDKLTIKIALEADFIPSCEDKSREIISGYPYDYIIGSVHFIGDWPFDNPADLSRWNTMDIDEVYKKYYGLLRQSAASGLFDIMGHVDLVKKFGHRPFADMANEVEETAEVFKRTGVAVEINTAGLRKPVKEIYPTLEVLKVYCRHGVPLTFGSDAHAPEDVGRDFDRAQALAKAAGYTEYLVYKNRQVERTIPLD